VTSERKIRANRANARASTGPKTAEGRARSIRNARRHGLSLPVLSDPISSQEVEELACEIAGTSANAEIHELARRALSRRKSAIRAFDAHEDNSARDRFFKLGETRRPPLHLTEAYTHIGMAWPRHARKLGAEEPQ
jgi:hypothetical protein